MNAPSRSRLLVLVLTLACLAAAGGAPAQTLVPDTLQVRARSPWEDGFYSLFDLTRAVQGGRVYAMGGAGLAEGGGPEYMALNPASLVRLTRPQLEAEGVYYTGGAGVNDYPRLLEVGPSQYLRSSGYRVNPASAMEYNNVSFGLPIVILGSRGALGASYRRVARSGQSEESRVELRIPSFENQEVTYGSGDEPREGIDAVSVGGARMFGPVSVGATLNWMSGIVTRTKDTGVSLFGFTILSGGFDFEQHVSGFNVDLGAQADLGRLQLGAISYLGYDLDCERGKAVVRPVPSDQTAERFVLFSTPLDQTISVPTVLGVGGSYALNDRLTLAGDYVLSPWSKTEITRSRIDPFFGFASPTDSTTFYSGFTVNANEEETFDARLEDSGSLRFGIEYDVIRRAGWSLPVRVGYRTEKLALSNVEVPDAYAVPQALVLEFFHINQIPEEQWTAEQRAVKQALAEMLEYNNLPFRGGAVDAGVISFGIGYETDTFGADLAIETKSYDVSRFYLDNFNPDPVYGSFSTDLTKESRSLLTVSFSTRWRF